MGAWKFVFGGEIKGDELFALNRGDPVRIDGKKARVGRRYTDDNGNKMTDVEVQRKDGLEHTQVAGDTQRKIRSAWIGRRLLG